MRIITYAVDYDGLVVSRVGSDLAIPVLNYEEIGQGGDFTGSPTYHLERCSVGDLVLGSRDWFFSLQWTKKIPVELKNRHREFWGMKPLRKGPENG